MYGINNNSSLEKTSVSIKSVKLKTFTESFSNYLQNYGPGQLAQV